MMQKLQETEFINMEWSHQITDDFGLWYVCGSVEDIKQFYAHNLCYLCYYDACDEDQ